MWGHRQTFWSLYKLVQYHSKNGFCVFSFFHSNRSYHLTNPFELTSVWKVLWPLKNNHKLVLSYSEYADDIHMHVIFFFVYFDNVCEIHPMRMYVIVIKAIFIVALTAWSNGFHWISIMMKNKSVVTFIINCLIKCIETI